MIRPDQIPDEVVEAALHAYDMSFKNDYTTGEQDIAAAIAAALNAWPEAKRVKGYFTHDTDYYEPAFILPLPQKDGSE